MVKRRIYFFTFLLLLSILSYFREVFFLSINSIISGETEFYAKTQKINFLMHFSVTELIKIKYLMTISFSLVFISITILGLKLSFQSTFIYKSASLLYGLIILIASLLILLSLIGDSFETIYPILRKLIGIIHNPLLFLLIGIGGFSTNLIKHSK